jgi:hypothetical protein
MSQNNDVLVNRVANSGLITINLEEFLPSKEVVPFDLKEYLFQGLILKEKDFRSSMKEVDWASGQGKVLAVYCSTDAIIPRWAYMLVSAYATPYYDEVVAMTPAAWEEASLLQAIATYPGEDMEGKRVVIKGCGEKEIPPSAYMAITNKLQPFAQSIMYGEPCSTVPIFKRPRVLKK